MRQARRLVPASEQGVNIVKDAGDNDRGVEDLRRQQVEDTQAVDRPQDTNAAGGEGSLEPVCHTFARPGAPRQKGTLWADVIVGNGYSRVCWSEYAGTEPENRLKISSMTIGAMDIKSLRIGWVFCSCCRYCCCCCRYCCCR